MNEAATKLIGEHDFRNLCKMDVGNGVVNFTRKILRADVTVLKELYVLLASNKFFKIFHVESMCVCLHLYV